MPRPTTKETRTCAVCGQHVPEMQGVWIADSLLHPGSCEAKYDQYRSRYRLPAIVRARLRERRQKASD